jgi:zinc transporter, ZIP family
MFEAFLWGAVGGSSLLIGALLAHVATPSPKIIAVVMALGAGLLIESISFELIDEAIKSSSVATVGLFTLVGAATFTVGDRLLDRKGGDADGPRATSTGVRVQV